MQVGTRLCVLQWMYAHEELLASGHLPLLSWALRVLLQRYVDPFVISKSQAASALSPHIPKLKHIQASNNSLSAPFTSLYALCLVLWTKYLLVPASWLHISNKPRHML